MSENNTPVVLQTLEYGLNALLCFRETNGAAMSLTEISKKIGRSVPNTYRLVYTLEQCGFLCRDPESKKYSLGAVVRQLGEYAIDNSALITIARPYLLGLHEKYNENVNLYVYQNYKCICIDRVESSQAVRESYPIGLERSLLRGSVGKSILAWLPPKVRTAVYQMEGGDHPSDMELAEIRTNGCAITYNETGKGTMGIAAPIFERRSKLVGTINISAPCFRFNDQLREVWSRDIKEAAAEITCKLGDIEL